MNAAASMIQGPGSRMVAHHHQPTAGRRGSSSVSARAWFKNLTGMGGAVTATAGAQVGEAVPRAAVCGYAKRAAQTGCSSHLSQCA